MKHGLSMKAFRVRVVYCGGNEEIFFTGMHISRTKLYSDSVHIFLCNKCVFQVGFYVDIFSLMTLFSVSHAPSTSVASQSIAGTFFKLSQFLAGVNMPTFTLPTIGQGTKTSLSCGSLKHSMVMTFFFLFVFNFAFRVPYIYACFYNVLFTVNVSFD